MGNQLGLHRFINYGRQSLKMNSGKIIQQVTQSRMAYPLATAKCCEAEPLVIQEASHRPCQRVLKGVNGTQR